MPRETAAARKEREALERAEEQKRKEAYQATLPLKLLQLVAKAQDRHDVTAMVHDHPEGGLRVRFTFPPVDAASDDFHCGTVTEYQLYHLSSETWDVEAVEREFERLEHAEQEAARKRKIAQEVYDSLTPEQREATGLRRP